MSTKGFCVKICTNKAYCSRRAPGGCISRVHAWPKGPPCTWAARSKLVMGHESWEAPSVH